jgi:formyl-CoA transferase
MLEADGDLPERTGNRHGGLAVCPYNIYPATDGWVAILCLRATHWSDLCRVMGRPDLAADPGLSTPSGRVDRMDDVDAAVAAWSGGLDKHTAFELLQKADIPASPVRSLSEVFHDAVLRDRGMITDIGTGDRACTVFGSPLQMGDSPVPIPAPAPVLGEHTDDVLRTWLNLPTAAIEQLRDDGVI